MKWICAFFMLLGVGGYLLGWFDRVTPKAVHTYVAGYRPLAPLIFIALFTVTPIVPFFSAVLAISGGLLLGLWWGSLFIMIGALLGGTVGFTLARSYGEWQHKYYHDTTRKKLEMKMEKNGFLLVLLLRLVPLIPFDLISYAAGFSRIRYKDYMGATTLGIIPGVLAYANIGASSLEVHSAAFYWALVFFITLTVVSLCCKRYVQRRFDL